MSSPTPLSRLGQTQHGELELVFEYRGGRTVLAHDRQKSPLQIVRPFEVDGDGLLAYIINPTAGVLGGDTFRIRVEVRAGAKVVLLTQTANKIHRMLEGQEGFQQLEFRVASGGRLEYYPERSIPFADSSYRQKMQVWLEPDAEFAFIESMSMGRIAHGECLAFRQFASENLIWQNGQIIYLDRFDLKPQLHDLQRLGSLEGKPFYANGLFVGSRQIQVELNLKDLATGQTAFQHLWLRGLAGRGVELDGDLAQVQSVARKALFGLEPLQVRR